MEYFIVIVGFGEDAVEVFPVGVGDEYLTEVGLGDEGDDVFHSLCIEFVEDVVEEDDGGGAAACALEEVELCEFEGYEVGFVLTL